MMREETAIRGPLSRTALKALRLKPAPGQQPVKRVWSIRKRAHIELFDPGQCVAMQPKRAPTQRQQEVLAEGRRRRMFGPCRACQAEVNRSELDRQGVCPTCVRKFLWEEEEERRQEQREALVEREAARWKELAELLVRHDRMVFIDTETTGLDPVVALDEIIEIAVVGPTGETILQSLVRPVAKTTWDEAQAVNGIAPADVADAPLLSELEQQLATAVQEAECVVIYNGPFDLAFLPPRVREIAAPKVRCAMRAFSLWAGEWSDSRDDFRRHKLGVAAAFAGFQWSDPAHRALADAQATRHVWTWLLERHEERNG